MKLIIENYFGIQNKIELNIKNKNVIFAPNGVGKSSIAKALLHGLDIKGSRDSILVEDLEMAKNASQDSYISFTDNDYKEIKNEFSNEQDGFEIKNIFLINNKKIKNFSAGLETTNIICSISWSKYLNKFPDGIYEEIIKIYNKAVDNIEKEITSEKKYNFIYGYQLNRKFNDFSNESQVTTIIEDLKYLLDKKINRSIKENVILIEKINEYKKLSNHSKKSVKSDKESKDIQLLNEIIFSLQNFITGEEVLYGKKICDKYSNDNKVILDNLDSYEEFLWLECLAIYFQNNEIDLNKLLVNIENNKKQFPTRFNRIIDELNNDLLYSFFLKWNIKINHINNYKDKIQLIKYNADRPVPWNNSIELSTGQNKILQIILLLVQSNSYKWTVMDDIFTSLDSDNMQILINYIVKSKNKIILLTHNYNLFANLIFSINENSPDDLQASFLDTYVNEEVIVTPIKSNEIKKLQKNSDFLNQEIYSNKGKALFCATIVREIMEQFLDFGEEINNIKSFLENDYRHLKNRKRKFSDFHKKFKNKNSELSFIFKIVKYLQIIENTKDKERISDFVLNYQPISEFNSMLDYIVNKYMLALKIRFKSEEIITKLESKKLLQKNKNQKFIKIIEWNKELQLNINSILHLNNLRWDAVFEMPLYKLNQYYDLIKEV